MTVEDLPEDLDLGHRFTASPDLIVWGLGMLGGRVLERVARRHPHRTFAAVTGDPGRAIAMGANVVPTNLDVLAGNQAPILVCVADNEGDILRDYLARGDIEASRAAVARSNHRLIAGYLDPERWRDRPVLVVTNPVEVLCTSLAEITGNPSVYGVGMQIDEQRCLDVLAAGWEITLAPGELPVTGAHVVEPLPVLSAVPGLADRISAEPWSVVTSRLQAAAEDLRLDWVRRPERMAAVFERRGPMPPEDPYGRVAVAVAALMSAEFDQLRPPVDRAIGHIADLVDSWLDGGSVAVSGPCQLPANGPEPVYLGGVLDVPSGVFRVPDLAAEEVELALGQVARLRALTATVGSR